MPKKPTDLSQDELIAVVGGLLQMLYGDCDEAGNPTWAPGMYVDPKELLAWARQETKKLDLVPEAGPQ